ncbi:hypothetical protein K378_05072 [Streptomyces sp. Amel2xB2]|uniref:hypothetical protein n=1 Tax=Streptomyces sp. Amel2xB2 TaxID=1305829 RepID=UPI000DBFBF33|nr:hypothetical protein [Streptomyces sp. Amel2xB2]RAJ58838.1 hypothetical protein K378_05072 [Streptomyces sp. Amel2xB2]
MDRIRRTSPLRVVLALLAAVLVPVLALAPAAGATPRADSVGEVAAALREGPVYVDPRAAGRLSGADAKDLTDKIKKSDKPVFIAVLPKAREFPPGNLLQDLRAQVGDRGVYGVVLGDRFAAGADRSVMPQGRVNDLRHSAEGTGGDTKAKLDRFVDGATADARGDAPASWNGGTDRGMGGGYVLGALVVLLILGAGGGFLVRGRARKRRAERERAELEKLRPVVDEDITAFGEELDRIGFDPQASGSDDAMRADYTRAIDSYDDAKQNMDAARGPGDVRPVTESLEDGRFALATLEARRAGEPLPERRMPCFFDPRHGPSAEDVRWAPPGGTERTVPVCAADAARLRYGEEPMARTVDTPDGRRPYWEAGPVYGPWAGGYFGGGILPGLLAGTLLGSALGPWGYGDYGDGGFDGGFGDGGFGDGGGDDFGTGGFGDGGGFGGGDFGGGGF